MARLHPRPDERAMAATRQYLAVTVPSWRPFAHGWVPHLVRVHVTHVEDGWVRLRFFGYDLFTADEVANALLHPDAVLVASAMSGGEVEHVFEGFGWSGEPPGPVLAANDPSDPRAPLSWSARQGPQPPARVDWGDPSLSDPPGSPATDGHRS